MNELRDKTLVILGLLFGASAGAAIAFANVFVFGMLLAVFKQAVEFGLLAMPVVQFMLALRYRHWRSASTWGLSLSSSFVATGHPSKPSCKARCPPDRSKEIPRGNEGRVCGFGQADRYRDAREGSGCRRSSPRRWPTSSD